MRKPLIGVLCKDDRDREVTERHARRACQQQWLSSKLVDVEYCRYRGKKHSNANHACGKQTAGVARLAQCREDRWRVVKH